MRQQVWHKPEQKAVPYSPEAKADTMTPVARSVFPKGLETLGPRIITSMVAIPVVLIVLWFGGWAAFICSVIIMGLGIYELKSMFEGLGYRPLTILSFLYGIALFGGAFISVDHPFFGLTRQTVIEAIISTLVLGSLSWLLITRHALGTALLDWSLTLVMTLYLAWPLSYLLTLRGSQYGNGSAGFRWLMIVLFGVWAFDSAAYFTGTYLTKRLFGRHALAPAVSQGKTWEGVAGGAVFAILAVYVFSQSMRQEFAIYHVVILGILISFAATIGDLAESLIKRQAGVKDSGNFFWGHGGVLDRIDSLLFVSVVVYFYVELVLHRF